MRHMRRTGALVLTAVVLLTVAARAQPSSDVEFTVLAAGTDSGIRTPTQVIIRDAAAWRALWIRHAGPAARPPSVDFGREMVVALFAGMQSMATRLAVSRIVREPDRLVVYYMLMEMRPLPQPEEMPAARPFVMVRLARSPLRVDVVRQRTPPVTRP